MQEYTMESKANICIFLNSLSTLAEMNTLSILSPDFRAVLSFSTLTTNHMACPRWMSAATLQLAAMFLMNATVLGNQAIMAATADVPRFQVQPQGMPLGMQLHHPPPASFHLEQTLWK